jgi:hypothetical protein
MPKTGRNIYKRKDGRWEGRYIKKRDAGDKIVYGYVYGKSCTEVKQRLALFNIDEPTSTTLIQNLDKGNNTFAEVASQWLSVISLKVKPPTHAEYITTVTS